MQDTSTNRGATIEEEPIATSCWQFINPTNQHQATTYMDFLDPLKRRRSRNRLLASYVLFGGLLTLVALALVFITNGYSFNTKTRTIVHQGLLFVDSKPSGARIWLNGADSGEQSGARLVLPTAKYNLLLDRGGYQPWRRSFNLKEQAVLRLDYALLVPRRAQLATVKSFAQTPTLFSASPDRHWLVVGGRVDKHTKSDLSLLDISRAGIKAQNLSLPTGLLASPGAHGGQLHGLGWSSDNRHLLLKYSYGSKSQFIMLDRVEPSRSVNLNKLFNASPKSVSLRDKRGDQVYTRNASGNLSVGLLAPAGLSKPFLKNVKTYTSLGSDIIFFAAPKAGNTAVNIWQAGRTYNLMVIKGAATPQLLAVNFGGHSYYAVGNPGSHFLNVYRDPLDVLRRPSPPRPEAYTSIRLDKVSLLKASPNSRMVLASNGQIAAGLDLELDASSKFKLSGSPPLWIDNFHLANLQQHRLHLIDFNGANSYLLVKASAGAALGSDNQRIMFTSATNKHGAVKLKAFILSQ